VAAAISSARIYEPLSREPFLHTSTFAGAPIAMAAAQAAVETIAEEGIVERAHELGITLLDQLRAIADGYPPELIEAVRGRGLLIGIEFAGEHLAGDFMLEMLARRVITNHSLNAHRVIRLTPAATLTPPEVSWLVDAADTSLQALAARYCT
jgi:putrescine aminotransferase